MATVNFPPFLLFNPTDPWAWMNFLSSDIFFRVLNFFYHKSLSFVWFELPQDTLYYLWLLGKVLFSPPSFSVHLSFVYKRATGFYELICIWLLCWKCLSAIGVPWWTFKGHLLTLLYHLQIRILWLFPFLFSSPLVSSSCCISLAET